MNEHEAPNNFAFQDVLFLGRDFTEYQKMFNLNPSQLKGKHVLDCASGPSSFQAEATMYEIKVTSCDPMYGASGEELAQRCRTDVERVGERQLRVSHLFHEYALSTQFKDRKKKSRELFIRDYAGATPGHYVHAELPSLPFDDNSFDLVLCANFLFLYTPLSTGGMLTEDRFDYAFHRRALADLLRVSCAEVRIYPIKGPHNENHHRYIQDLIKETEFAGSTFSFEEVTYRDIRDAHELLKLSK
jgi:hypothetical protein